LISGVLGVPAILVFPTLAFLLGLLAVAAGAYARRGAPSKPLTAAIGLSLGVVAVVAVLVLIVFFSNGSSGRGHAGAIAAARMSLSLHDGSAPA
jgi:hypothetical protein